MLDLRIFEILKNICYNIFTIKKRKSFSKQNKEKFEILKNICYNIYRKNILSLFEKE